MVALITAISSDVLAVLLTVFDMSTEKVACLSLKMHVAMKTAARTD